jgi:cysteine-rich repeat protein
MISLWFGLALAAPVSDAQSWTDSFDDVLGIDAARTTGFSGVGGAIRANSASATLVTDCISLSPPASGAFEGWSFLDLETSRWDLVTAASLTVEDCATGSVLLTGIGLSGDCDAVDLSGLPPTASGIRLAVSVAHTGIGDFASVDALTVYGRSSSVVELAMAPTVSAVSAGESVTFSVSVGANGATLLDPELVVDLDATNADPLLVADGFSPEIGPTSPLQFRSASLGLAGESPQTPVFGASSGAVVWSLEDVLGGTAGDVTFALDVPTGTIDQRTVGAGASLTEGPVSTCDPGLDDRVTHDVDTRAMPVPVSSVVDLDPFLWTPFFEVHPDESIQTTWILDSEVPAVSDKSDLEDVVVTIDPTTSTCVPVYRGHDWAFPSDQPATYSVGEVISEPSPGSPWTAPLVVRTPRMQQASALPTVSWQYDMPPLGVCADGSEVVLIVSMDAGAPAGSWGESLVQTYREENQVCRIGSPFFGYRTMSGDEVPNGYNPFPNSPVQEAYLSGFVLNEFSARIFSIGEGDWYGMWLPFANDGDGAPSVPVDGSYVVGAIPDYATYRGITFTPATDPYTAFKDCSGTAIEPQDPGFDPSDPSLSGWWPMAVDVSEPFTSPPADDDPTALVPGGCRVLVARTPDDPGNGGSMRVFTAMRMCDATSEALGWCSVPAPGSEIRSWSEHFVVSTRQGDTVNLCVDEPARATWVFEEASWPRVFASTPTPDVAAGSVATLVLEPHNENQASRAVDAVWGFDLYAVRDHIDFDRLTGQVVLPTDARVPGDGDTDAIVFHPPDVDACATAAGPGDPDCLAWWEVPQSLGLPNYWGVADPQTNGRLFAIDSYQFELNLPVRSSTPAGTPLDVVAEARSYNATALSCDTDDDCGSGVCATGAGVCWQVGDLGAANKAPRYDCGELCTETTTLDVLEVPNLQLRKAGPASWPSGTFAHRLTVRNDGNAPQLGCFVVDQLPKAGVNGGTLTPSYGAVLVDQAVVVEVSADADCHTPARAAVLDASWTPMPLSATGRSDFPLTTAPLSSSDACFRLRRADGAPALPTGEDVRALVELGLPAVPVTGDQVANVGFVGATIELGALAPVALTATEVVVTEVSDEVAIALDKVGVASLTVAGQVDWELSWQNISGIGRSDADLSDCLPAGHDVVQVTPEGTATCVSCAATVTPDCPTGELTWTTGPIDPDDAADGGSDAGLVRIVTVDADPQPGEPVVNGGTLAVQAGTGGVTEAELVVSELDVSHTLVAEPDNQASPPTVLDGEVVRWSITATRTGSTAAHLRIRDELPADLVFVPGSLQIDGATAPDRLVDGQLVELVTPAPLGASETTTVTLLLRVTPGGVRTLTNDALVQACKRDDDLTTCDVAYTSEAATLEVVVCGDGVVDRIEACDDGGVLPYDGCSAACQLEPDTDGDGLLDPFEVDVSGTDPTVPDTDGDGVSDGDENATDPLDADSDDDGLSDGDELLLGTDPTAFDSDGDGLSDGLESGVAEPLLGGDSDGGVGFVGTDPTVFVADADPSSTTDPTARDSDGDGLDDDVEDLDADGAFSGDLPGLTDDETDPTRADSDGDGLSDGEEGGPSELDEDTDGTIDALDPCAGDHLGNDDLDGDRICSDRDRCPAGDDRLDADGDGVADACDVCADGDDAVDTDANGVPDACEVCGDGQVNAGETCDDGNADPYDGCGATCLVEPDTDGDGWSDAAETDLYGTDPITADTDGDGIDDVDEAQWSTDPLDADTDDDGLSDGAELAEGTDPTVADTDEDGLDDGLELGVEPVAADLSPGGVAYLGTDPAWVPDADPTTTTDPLASDTDGDGLDDGVEDVNGDGAFDGDQPGLEADETDPLDADTDDDGADDASEGGPGTADDDGDDRIDALDTCVGDDALGDADGDAVCDDEDACPGFDDGQDTDGDGVPNGCDVCDGEDDVADADGDGTPDACDVCEGSDDSADADADGVPDGCDVCPDGDDGADRDGDDVPDACDPCPDGDDTDGDGVCDTDDLCEGDDALGDADDDGVCDEAGTGVGDDDGDKTGSCGCDNRGALPTWLLLLLPVALRRRR